MPGPLPLYGTTGGAGAPTAAPRRYPGAEAAVTRAFPGGAAQHAAYVRAQSHYALTPMRGTAGAPTAGGGSPWVPPPLPSGSYNPQRDIEIEESQRGLGQLEGEIGTARSRDSADFATAASEIGRREAQQQQDYSRAKELLGQSYQRLGVRQQEGANRAGVLTGGALLQAAAKRAVNQGTEQRAADTNYNRSREADSLELAKLIREAAPPDATNPEGGRQFQDLLTKVTNAQANNAFFQKSEHALEGQEAAEHGYVAPTAPAAKASGPRKAQGGPTVLAIHHQPSSVNGSALMQAATRQRASRTGGTAAPVRRRR
jgi:hypothetical protein